MILTGNLCPSPMFLGAGAVLGGWMFPQNDNVGSKVRIRGEHVAESLLVSNQLASFVGEVLPGPP